MIRFWQALYIYVITTVFHYVNHSVVVYIVKKFFFLTADLSVRDVGGTLNHFWMVWIPKYTWPQTSHLSLHFFQCIFKAISCKVSQRFHQSLSWIMKESSCECAHWNSIIWCNWVTVFVLPALFKWVSGGMDRRQDISSTAWYTLESSDNHTTVIRQFCTHCDAISSDEILHLRVSLKERDWVQQYYGCILMKRTAYSWCCMWEKNKLKGNCAESWICGNFSL